MVRGKPLTIASRNAQASQCHDLDVAKILTDTAFQLEGFCRCRIDGGCLCIIFELFEDPRAERRCDLANRLAGLHAVTREGCDIGIVEQARALSV